MSCADHLQGSRVSTQAAEGVPGTAGATDQLELGLHCIALHVFTFVQKCKLLAAPTSSYTTGHVAGLPAGREASLAAQQAAAAAAQAEERGALSNFAMQLLHRPPCHALLLRPQLLTACCWCCKATA